MCSLKKILDLLFYDRNSWVPTVVAFLILLFVLFVLKCGGDGDNGNPVYDNGVCVANCLPDNGPDNGKSDLADIYGGDQPPDGSTDQAEVEQYACPNPDNLPWECVPKEAKEAKCIFFDGIGNPPCDLTKTDKCWCGGGFHDQENCTTDSFCQQVPDDQWPPCVCWQFCGYAGEWKCGNAYNVTLALSDAETYCKISTDKVFLPPYLIGQPDKPPPRYPSLENPEWSFYLQDNKLYIDSFNEQPTECSPVQE